MGAPPASDVSNRGKANTGGFTGLESLWTYFFWQSNSLNAFDELGHVLRLGVTATDCTPLENRSLQSDPELKSKFDKCNGWLGPNQPGNTTPDFTRGGAQASARREGSAEPATKVGERRSAGQPDAGPVAGQRDISKPQVVLPPAVQQLVDSLTKNTLPEPARDQVNTDKVDQLLSGEGPKTEPGQQPSPATTPRLPVGAMRNRSAGATLVASPVLVGAVTLLITIVAVFIAYNANAGLPFVPTYDLKAQLPTGNKLVAGNEVRVGGFRVGVVDDIQPEVVQSGGETKSVAVVAMKLDKTVEPLARNTTIKVRPRSALGLKYVEVTPGKGRKSFAAGSTVPLRNASEGLELEDVFSTLDDKTRRNSQGALDGFGDAFTGRGRALNTSIQALNPFFSFLTPVMSTLNDPDTQLDQFFPAAGRDGRPARAGGGDAGRGVRQHGHDVRGVQREPGGAAADDREVAAHDGRRRALVPGPAPLPGRLRRPVAAPAPGGQRAAPLAARHQQRVQGGHTGAAAHRGAQQPPRRELRRPRRSVREPQHAAGAARPAHHADRRAARRWSSSRRTRRSATTGTTSSTRWASTSPRSARWAARFSSRAPGRPTTSRPTAWARSAARARWTPRPGVDPVGAEAVGSQLMRLYASAYQPAIDAQGNADCQIGQNGLVRGPLGPNRYAGVETAPTAIPAAATAAVTISNFPILSGGTYKSRELGLNNLRDVDKLR